MKMNFKLSYLMAIFNIVILFSSQAQNVAITDDSTYIAQQSAMLDVKSENKGILVPRLTSSQRLSIPSPAVGLLVYDKDFGQFYYYTASGWVSLPNVNGSAGTEGGPLFFVVNDANDTIFAVYNDGVKITLPETAKGSIGGFAVSGRTTGKSTDEDYLRITRDSARIYVNEAAKGSIGGFAVSGRTTTGKGALSEYLVVTSDSTRVYVSDTLSSKGSIGGFAVSGRTNSKSPGANYLEVTRDSTRVYFTEDVTKGSIGGFAVSGRTNSKTFNSTDYFNISGSVTAQKIYDEPRILWYPLKEAFLAGQVHVGSADSVGQNSTAIGYRNISKGDFSQAFGYSSRALATNATAIGRKAYAGEVNSFALGDSALAMGVGAFAIGSVGRKPGGESTGEPTRATGMHSIALGMGAQSTGFNSTAIGNHAFAQGINSFALGDSAYAEGKGSFAIGSVGRDSNGNSTGNAVHAKGMYSFAFGLGTSADTLNAFVWGNNSTASGISSTAFGLNCTSTGNYSVAGGRNTVAFGVSSLAIGDGSYAGEYSVALGEDNIATARNSVAIGNSNFSEYQEATVLGSGNEGQGYGAVAVGAGNYCTNTYTYSFGGGNHSSGLRSMTMGYFNEATKEGSVGIGNETNATGAYSVALGVQNTASGLFSMSFGRYIEAAGEYSMAFALSDQNGTTITQDNTMAIMGGRVGIGVAAPSDTLDVAGSLNLNNGISSGPALKVNGSNAISFDVSTGRFMWGGGGSINYMSDNLGLGVLNPSVRLHLKQNTANEAIRIIASGDTNYWGIGVSKVSKFDHNLRFYYNANYKAQISYVDGSYSNSSDKRLKKNIESIGFVLDKVIQLNPSKFHFKEIDDSHPKSIGFIAQEVEPLFPDLVSEFEKEGVTYKALTYDNFAVLSIQAIIDLNQKLETELNKKDTEIDKLKESNQKLANKYNELLKMVQKIQIKIENQH